MGNPIVPPPPTYIRGVQCTICEDFHWPVGSTPASFIASVFGVSPCNGYSSDEVNFSLQINQVPLHPCRWLGNDFLSNTVYWQEPTMFPPLTLTFLNSEEPGGDDIMTGLAENCETGGLNDRDACDPGIAGINGGFSVHTFSPVDYVAVNYNFVPVDETFSETFNGPDIGPVYRFASKKYSINVKIKVDLSLMPVDQEGIF